MYTVTVERSLPTRPHMLPMLPQLTVQVLKSSGVPAVTRAQRFSNIVNAL